MASEIICGDALEVLRSLPAEYVQTVVTSPPYYGLRDYGTATWIGGDEECSHTVGSQVQDNKAPGAILSGVRPGCDASRCKVCGAIRKDQQIGLEETPGVYVAKLVEVFREVRRVLRSDGVAWVNLGDSYAAGKAGRTDYGTGDHTSTLGPHRNGLPGNTRPGPVIQRSAPDGYKPKDLMMIPARVAIALCDDGWYLRADCIWHKTNAMPESVKDRPTKAHEYVFLLSKNERYFYDSEAVKEPVNIYTERKAPNQHKQWAIGQSSGNTTLGLNPERAGRNKRSVWSIPTTPYPGSHFAVMAPKLAETCILAGSRPGDIVLDPFSGAGTTAYVANRLNRRYLGIELNPAYVEMSRHRLAQLALEVAG